VGEIAEALRKANEPVDGSKVETDSKPRNDDGRSDGRPGDTSGEISAALSRAGTAAAQRTPSDAEDSPSSQAPSPNVSSNDLESTTPGNLDDVIFHVERHRHLGLRLRTELDRGSQRSLAIVSAARNEGKTIVCCNIAAAIASVSRGRSVALLDLDLRNPSIARMLKLQISVGIEQVLQGRAELDEARISLSEPEIDVYPCAQPHRAAHELLILPSLEAIIRKLEARYSAVVIDTPPTLLVPDATLIMRSAGYCIAVARSGQTRVHRFTEMLDRLPTEKILGKVLNQVPLPSHARSDDDYYYYGNEDS